jgi:hypothetical protein
MTQITEIKREIDLQVADQNTLNTLLSTTFKGLAPSNVKPAILEGMLRGFHFEDFLKKNVYAIPFRDGYSLVTSIDYSRKVGQKSGIVGTDAPVFTEDDSGIKTCSVTVHKKTGDHVGSYTATVYFDEYTTKKNLWVTKPRTMIAKVAEMHALRKACPEELAQAYVQEEKEKEVVQVPVIDLTAYETKLNEAKTLDEVKKIWADMPVEAKEKLNPLKEELKKKYEGS